MVVSRNCDEYDELYDWLNGFEFSRQKRNLSRDFSDGVLVAEILKRFYPRLVDLHNYNGANSHAAKMENWLTLDRKVLSNIGLRETKESYWDLAACSRGKIEAFLLKIKKKIDSDQKERDLQAEDQSVEIEPPTLDEFTNLLENLRLKEEEIESLSKRINHIESLLKFKEQRIQDLNYQISTCCCNLTK